MGIQRYFLKLSYLGTAYHGWQIQENAHSVQACLEESLKLLCRQQVPVTAAGRTDTGVHARQMYAHIDLHELPHNFLNRLNSMLPKDISIADVLKVRNDAHARFSANSRSYEYIIGTKKDAFLHDRAYFLFKKLDVGKMNQAAQLLLGEQDFSSFSKSRTQTKHNFCNITAAEWYSVGDTHIFNITANRFLRNMVRAIVGSLLQVGKGEWEVEDIRKIILSKDRCNAGFSVPAKALYLTSVTYPEEVFI